MIVKAQIAYCVNDIKQQIENGKFSNIIEAYKYLEKKFNETIDSKSDNIIQYKQEGDNARIREEMQYWINCMQLNTDNVVLPITRYYINVDNVIANIEELYKNTDNKE